MGSTTQRHVAVLGGSAGIGLATARLATERGARVTLGGRDKERLDAAVATLDSAVGIPVDAEDPASLAEFFRAAGPVDDVVITVTRRGFRAARGADHLGEADLPGSFAGKAIATLRAVGESLAVLAERGSITLDALGAHRDETLHAMAGRTPLGRNGHPGDVAAAILALIENDFVTGVVLPVDGGIRLT